MSDKKKTGLPKMAGRRRKELAAKAPPAPIVKKEAPLPPPPAPPTADLLADFIKSEAKAKAAPQICTHKHLLFQNMGAVLKCVDCPRRFHILMEGAGSIPDYGYFNTGNDQLDSRHTAFEPARIIPMPAKKA